MQLTLHLREEDGQILCQFGVATFSRNWISSWFQAGCRELVISTEPHPEGRGKHLRREYPEATGWLLAAELPVPLLPPLGHPELNEFNELWIWPLVPLAVQRHASPGTHTASAVLVA